MNVNGEAIYGTTGDNKIGQQGKMVFTHKPDAIYAIYRAEEGESLPAKIEIKNLTLDENSKISLLGSKDPLKWTMTNGTVSIVIPEKTAKVVAGSFAWVFKISA
jgi:alpha-L-fucosidase